MQIVHCWPDSFDFDFVGFTALKLNTSASILFSLSIFVNSFANFRIFSSGMYATQLQSQQP